MYTLDDTVAHLRGMPWVAHQVEGELVEGYFDGINTTFRVASPPITDPATLVVLDPAGAEVYSVSNVNADTGAFTVSPAPHGPITASYEVGLLPKTKLEWVAREGLDEMESRWRRDFQYVSFPGGGYGITADPVSPTDPMVTGSKSFTQSRVQLAFYHKCCEYVLLRQLAQEAAHNSIYYREERVGGLSVDATRRVRDFNVLIEEAFKSMVEKEYQARSESGDNDEFGFFLPGPRLVNGRWIDYGAAE